MMQLSKRSRQIYNKLTNFELQQDKKTDSLLSDEDIFGDLAKKERPRLFLDFYSEEGINKALLKYGVFRELRKMGFSNFIIDLDTRDPYHHKFRAYHQKNEPDFLICEVYVRKKSFTAKPTFKTNIYGETLALIVVEWLTLQNPLAKFTAQRPQLPGQKFPGLGIGRKVLEIFINMCIRLKTDGLLNVPEHYHNATFYGRYFKYFNPQTEGYFHAIKRDLSHLGLHKLTWAIDRECLVDTNTGEYWKWFTDEQILPVSEKMERHFFSKEYVEQVKHASESVKFIIDEKKFNQMKDKIK